ncbi:CdaR family transcriptional regulator [Alkalibacter mobilis]|uniref:CdaR family transcriptional regulator n=1 Tax=Alkalibacter mobilis TaxID=2787712 RepID=UPI00189F3EF9|nr:sugar diacid recognition domain-containing protein [Alkalibacter mobilis]MBF7096207.1 helix-turn-helix domain-containing protein [Alkalibacter mobilis]
MTILSASMAQRFIDKMAQYMEYNINIMNENGTIIASRDESRIGNFHEVAYEMLHGESEQREVEEEKKFIGTKPGVNLVIEYKNKPVGVVGVTGDPGSVKAFAGLVKVSLEAMIEYEVYMEKKRTRRNKTEQFMYTLLFEENPDISLLENLAAEIELKKNLLAVAIIIKVNKSYDRLSMISAIRASKNCVNSDLITVASNDNIVILKAVEAKGNNDMFDYKYEIREFIEDFMSRMSDNFGESDFGFFIGSLQNKIGMYRHSYFHANEMLLHVKEKEGIHFFDCNIIDHFRSIVTMKEYSEIFNTYNDVFSTDDQQMIAETVEVLGRNNYNMVNSAKDLFMHRNTLVFRLNKIKNTLNIDPISNSADREFLNELAYYFRNK